MARVDALYEAVLKGKRKDVSTIVQDLVEAQCDVAEILMESMIPAMAEIGDRFSRNEAYVPEMLIAARAMQAGLDAVMTAHIALPEIAEDLPAGLNQYMAYDATMFIDESIDEVLKTLF